MHVTASPTSDAEAAAEGVLAQLYRYGHQYEFVGGDMSAAPVVSAEASRDGGDTATTAVALNATERIVMYYVMDELGSRFGEARDPNFSM